MSELVRRVVPGGTALILFPTRGQVAMVRTEFFDGSSVLVKEPLPITGLDRSSTTELDVELTRHFIAMALQWPASHGVWRRAHAGRSPPGWTRDQDWPYAAHDEDVLVMHAIGYLANGRLDGREDLQAVWGHRLTGVMAHLVSWLKPWVKPPSFPLPLPLRPEDVSFPLRVEEEAEVPLGRAALRAWS